MHKISRTKSAAHRALLATARLRNWPIVNRVWHNFYNRTRHWNTPITSRIHGFHTVLGFNYAYPFFVRFYPTYNNPLVELVHQVSKHLNRKITLVDVGAAIGDTVMLVEANCPNTVEKFVSIDGDAEFFSYLEQNLAQFSNCQTILSLLSRERSTVRQLVRTHGGTASAQGEEQTNASPLDDILTANKIGPIDVLKIDVDGFDGEVLAGAHQLLRNQKPAVIFEWHPKLCRQTSNDPFRGFSVLSDAGYNNLIWFTKFGVFSHFSPTLDRAQHLRLHEYCSASQADTDLHYDIIALPDSLPIKETSLADCHFALGKSSRY